MQMRCKCKIFIHHVPKSPNNIVISNWGRLWFAVCPQYAFTSSTITTTSTNTMLWPLSGLTPPVRKCRILSEQSFTARMPLLMAKTESSSNDIEIAAYKFL